MDLVSGEKLCTQCRKKVMMLPVQTKQHSSISSTEGVPCGECTSTGSEEDLDKKREGTIRKRLKFGEPEQKHQLSK